MPCRESGTNVLFSADHYGVNPTGEFQRGFAPIAIGLGLTLIHPIGIPVTTVSVNPARSTGPGIFVSGWALVQLWLFWVAPIIGGTVGGVLYAAVFRLETTTAQTSVASKSRAAVASDNGD